MLLDLMTPGMDDFECAIQAWRQPTLRRAGSEKSDSLRKEVRVRGSEVPRHLAPVQPLAAWP